MWSRCMPVYVCVCMYVCMWVSKARGMPLTSKNWDVKSLHACVCICMYACVYERYLIVRCYSLLYKWTVIFWWSQTSSCMYAWYVCMHVRVHACVCVYGRHLNTWEDGTLCCTGGRSCLDGVKQAHACMHGMYACMHIHVCVWEASNREMELSVVQMDGLFIDEVKQAYKLLR